MYNFTLVSFKVVYAAAACGAFYIIVECGPFVASNSKLVPLTNQKVIWCFPFCVIDNDVWAALVQFFQPSTQRLGRADSIVCNLVCIGATVRQGKSVSIRIKPICAAC